MISRINGCAATIAAPRLIPDEDGQLVFVDGKNITDQLKVEEISRGAAIVAAQPLIREIMTNKQRKLGEHGKVVMDGRDIGTVKQIKSFFWMPTQKNEGDGDLLN
jgi:cytidylate kinase